MCVCVRVYNSLILFSLLIKIKKVFFCVLDSVGPTTPCKGISMNHPSAIKHLKEKVVVTSSCKEIAINPPPIIKDLKEKIGATTSCKEISIDSPSIKDLKEKVEATTSCKEISINCPSIITDLKENVEATISCKELFINPLSIGDDLKEGVPVTSPLCKAISTNPTTIPAKVVSNFKRIELPFKLQNINQIDKSFVESLFVISDKISHPSFVNAIIIGKKDLFATEILSAKIEGDAIYEDLSIINKENLAKLLEKVRQMRSKFTVCCLLFDLSSVSTTVNLNACSFYGCKETLHSVFGGESNKNKIERIKDVVKELSSILPVIVFPLFPAAVYSVDSSSKVKHDAAHKFLSTNKNLYLIDEKFANCIDDINTNWKHILENQNENNVCHPLMLNFVKHGGTPFFCKNTDSGNLIVRHISKKMTWTAFICIVLQTCVCSGKITVCSPVSPAPVSTSRLKKGKSGFRFYFVISYLSKTSFLFTHKI